VSTTKAALTDGYKREHDQLDSGLAAMTETLDRLQRQVDADQLKALGQTKRFLEQVFVPHANWEELTFYPALGDLVRRYGDPNAAMFIDHREIMRRIEEFVALAGRVEAGERDPETIDRARILAYQIQALVDAHERKEEEIYVALLNRHMSDRDVVHVLTVGDQLGHD
jgi:hemerythrin-like domain-containing protein